MTSGRQDGIGSTALLRSAARVLARHRRALAGLCAALAVLTGLASVRPPAPSLVPVLVAAVDLPAGTALRADDLTVARQAAGSAGPAALAEPGAVVDRVLIGPVLAGEPITSTRLVGGPAAAAGRPDPGAGRLAAPVRIADPGAVALLSPGDVVDVLAAGDLAQQARVVAHGVRVLTVPRARGTGGDGLLSGGGGSATSTGDGSLVVLAVDSGTALGLAQAAAAGQLSVVLHPAA